MKKILDILEQKCWKIEISRKKSKIMRIVRPLENAMDIVTLDQVLEYKYLGVKLNNKPMVYFSEFAQSCLNKSFAVIPFVILMIYIDLQLWPSIFPLTVHFFPLTTHFFPGMPPIFF